MLLIKMNVFLIQVGLSSIEVGINVLLNRKIEVKLVRVVYLLFRVRIGLQIFIKRMIVMEKNDFSVLKTGEKRNVKIERFVSIT